jgi:hypothetical protein
VKRRAFLAATSGALVVLLPGCSIVPVIPKRPAPDLDDAAGWVRHEAGRYTVNLPRAEMGQNIATAFKQIACDELDVGWDVVDVQLIHTAQISRVKGTVGSDSVKDYALPLAQACASLRLALARGQHSGMLRAQNIPVAALRSFGAQARWTGKPAAQVQGRDIMTGQPLYAADVRRAGMVYGRVLRAPAVARAGVTTGAAGTRRLPHAPCRALLRVLRDSRPEPVNNARGAWPWWRARPARWTASRRRWPCSGLWTMPASDKDGPWRSRSTWYPGWRAARWRRYNGKRRRMDDSLKPGRWTCSLEVPPAAAPRDGNRAPPWPSGTRAAC